MPSASQLTPSADRMTDMKTAPTKAARVVATGKKKDVPLEAVRGLAAVTVLIWHTMLGFFPQWSGAFPDHWTRKIALTGQIWFGLIDGTAAVTLFFVLSGFVLTRRFLLSGDQQIILRGAIKRWPRLAGPVLMSVLVSWLLFRLGAYHFTEGGAATGSPWLSKFAAASEVPYNRTLWDALRQGVYATFFRGDSYYDTSLWTMRYEFIGSFIAFGLALLLALLPKETKPLRLAMLAVMTMLCYSASPLYAAFPAGVALASFLPEGRGRLSGWAAGGLILIAIYLFGFTGAKAGVFVPAAWILRKHVTAAQILASMLVITAVELAPEGFRRPLSSRFAERLGTLSFPLYLIHVLVLCSFGCVVLIWARTWATGVYPNIIAGAATIVASIFASIPLVMFNERWVTRVNTATNRLLLFSVRPINVASGEASLLR